MKIEVIYAGRQRQAIVAVNVEDDASIEAAIRKSGILQQFPEIDLASQKVGIFGKPKPLDTLLKAGDRIETYRPAMAGARKRSGGDEADSE
ncbi:MAG: RnfH family protein [Candidatus Dactylopiibacterium carminicum]|nr:MAG: RnfH family protein [Candidatus Dactylopiibacterium carminicum]